MAVGLVAVLAVVVGTVVLVAQLRSREITDAHRSLFTLSAALSEATSRSLQGVDLVLTSIVDEWRAEGIATGDDLRRLKGDRRTFEALHARVTGLPQLNGISVVGPDGRLVNFSRSFPPPAVDLSDRDHFRALTAPVVPEPFVSETVQNRGSGEWSIYLVRRLLAPDGALAGLVYGAIDLRYFQDFYASLNLGRGSAISLWHLDGRLIVRQPPVPGVGQRFDPPGLDEVTPATAPSVIVGATALDGQARLVARRVVAGVPIVTVASRTVSDVLAEWRRQALIVGSLGTLLCLAVLVVIAALVRQIWAYEAVALATRERQEAVQGRDEVAAQLRQAQKMEAMGQLTSGLAHDFNNLLTVVLGNLDLLDRRLPDDPSLRRYADSARAGAVRAAALTQRLLAFSRRQALEPVRLDLNALVGGMGDLLRQTLGERTVLAMDLAPSTCAVYADPNGLESALLNLVVNARDAMPEGGTVTVETRCGETDPRGGQAIRLTVADTGTGMPPEVARRAFEPFFTTKQPGVGTGLGLAQVYGFAQQCKGSVDIESREGAGTRITIHMPEASSVPEAVAAPEAPRAREAAP